MTQYIEKSALVAEIESKKKYAQILGDNAINSSMQQFYDGMKQGCVDLLSFIDTLEVKEVQEEPVSEDLEEASKEWLKPQLDKSYANYGETKMMELTHFDGYAMLDAIEFGAKWKDKEMQSTIELAEDHAMLAGMEKMKEQIMAKAVETTFKVSLPSGLYEKLWIKGCKEGDKLLVIKKDEL